MSRRGSVAAGWALLAAACTLGPDYKRPNLDVPASYRGLDAEPAEAAGLAETPWWGLFGDPVLDDLIDAALAENRDLLIAAARIAEARARFRVTHADRLPQVGAGAEALREQDSPDLTTDAVPENTFLVGASVAWEVDLWGRLRRADEAARAFVLASVEARRGVIQILTADVARVYFELGDLDRRLAIAIATVKTRQDALEIARLRFEGGLTSQLEARQAETELARAESLVPVLQQQRTEKENELGVLLGRSPGDIPRGRELDDHAVPPSIPAGLPSDLLERRPDIRAAEQALVAANAQVGVAVASLYPRLSLSAGGGSESDELGRVLASGTGIWELAANLTAPLWAGGRLRAEADVSRARFEQSVLEYDRTVLQALREVANALAASRNTHTALETQERLELASRQYLDLARLQYANGVVPYLDVLDAQRQLFTAELDLSTATRDRLLAVVELYRSLGGGWAAAEERAESRTADAEGQ